MNLLGPIETVFGETKLKRQPVFPLGRSQNKKFLFHCRFEPVLGISGFTPIDQNESFFAEISIGT